MFQLLLQLLSTICPSIEFCLRDVPLSLAWDWLVEQVNQGAHVLFLLPWRYIDGPFLIY